MKKTILILSSALLMSCYNPKGQQLTDDQKIDSVMFYWDSVKTEAEYLYEIEKARLNLPYVDTMAKMDSVNLYNYTHGKK